MNPQKNLIDTHKERKIDKTNSNLFTCTILIVQVGLAHVVVKKALYHITHYFALCGYMCIDVCVYVCMCHSHAGCSVRTFRK